MKPSVEPLARWALCSIVLGACAGSPPPAVASGTAGAASGGQQQTEEPAAPPRKIEPPSELAGLVPCAKDAPEGSGCATKGSAAPTERTGNTKKVDDAVWRVTVGRDDPARGPSEALVTLVVFSDFECPFCRNGAGVLEALLAEYPAEVRLVWKDLPLPMHAQAEPAAELARAARARLGDDGFWRAHALLYDAQASLGEATYQRIAQQLGLPWGEVRAAIRGARYGAVIREGVALSDRVDVPATPTTFVNGRKVVGAQPHAVFKPVIEEELAKAKQLLNRGVSRAALYAAIVKDGREVPVPSTDMAVPAP